MSDHDEAIAKICAAAGITLDKFHEIVREAARREIAILRKKVNQSLGKEVDHVRTW
jgi:hypothetical protein